MPAVGPNLAQALSQTSDLSERAPESGCLRLPSRPRESLMPCNLWLHDRNAGYARPFGPWAWGDHKPDVLELAKPDVVAH